MKCPSCQHDSPPEAKFCPQCGAPLARACASCGTPLPAAARFCPACAHPVGAAAETRFGTPQSYTPKHLAERILTSKIGLQGERKQVTVLFADMKGSMEAVADRDPEDARDLLDPVLELMMEAVHRYDGTVNQVMGDGIMALFGAPVAHEDHAMRACYAALRMQEGMKRYAQDVHRTTGVPLHIRVGLNSGEVVVRSIASDLRMEYSALGQTVHLAARMEQMAMPGSTLMAPETLRLAEPFVVTRSLGLRPVKGLPNPIEVHELVGAGTGRSRLSASAGRGLTRFVGRQTEVAHLRRALERAGAGRGQVVAVVGDAGVGKSRLLYELTHSAAAEGWLILEGAAVSYGRATPYLPLVDLLRRYFGILDHDEASAVRRKVSERLHARDHALQASLPVFCALLDVPVDDPQWDALDPSQRRARTLEAIKRLILKESQSRPVLVVVEDLHWADLESQAVLDSLIDSVPAARILLVVDYRPEYEPPWSRKSYATFLRLDPLLPTTCDELLRHLLGGDVSLEATKHLVVERTEGNPFFLEESVRTLVETGTLSGARGAYRLSRPLDALQVPATVQAVLAARIDRLPIDAKRLLQSAAVIGKDVPFTLLRAIAELPDDDLRRDLTHLQAAEFLHETKLFPELELTFKHSLTHEMAYGSLLQDRRRSLHGAIVDAIEALHRDRLAEHVEQLAHHAVRGERWPEAVRYCREAGTKAFARSAHGAAVACFEQALAALEHRPRTRETIAQGIDLRLDLRYSLIPLAEFRRILDHLREAEALAQEIDDEPRLGLISAFLTSYFYLMGNLAQAIESGRRATTIAERRHDASLAAVASAYLAQAHYALGDYADAIAWSRRSFDAPAGDLIRRPFGMALEPSVYSRSVLVSSLAERGEFDEGRACAEEGVRIAEAVEHPYSLIFAYLALGRLRVRREEFHEARAVLEHALALCRSVPVPVLLPLVAAPLASAYASTGRVADALALLEPLARPHDAAEFKFGRSAVLIALGDIHVRTGRIEDAITLGRAAIELCDELGARGHRAWASRLLGDAYAHRDPPGRRRAAQCYREAIALAGTLGMRPLEAQALAGLARLEPDP
jgi:class 3 adenylate cyclase/tetratricopeptide (TPR) repeat protein